MLWALTDTLKLPNCVKFSASSVTFTVVAPSFPSNNTSYVVILPFWSSGGTTSQAILTLVNDITVAVMLVGEAFGADKQRVILQLAIAIATLEEKIPSQLNQHHQ